MLTARKLLVGLVSLLIVALANPVLAQDRGVTVRRIDAREFPKVDLVVSSRGLDDVTSDDLSVTENGSSIEVFDIRDLSETGVTIDAVLIIDTSGSMEGAPMAAAKAAAARFVKALPSEVRVGAVTFSDAPSVLTPVTTDHEAVLRAVDGLSATGETAMYDGVVQASKLFAGKAQRNMILLSDGGDTASKAGLPQALAAVKDSHSVVFSVGLETPETDVSALRKLSKRSGGRYSPAGETDLSGIYQGLAEEIKGQFIVSYKSQAESGEQTTVQVEAAGVSDSLLFLPPKVEARDKAPEQVAEEATRFRPSLIAVLAFVFLCSTLALRLLVGDRVTRRRRRRLRSQIATEQRPEETSQRGESGLATYIPSAMSSAAERIAETTRMADRFDRLLERAGLNLKLGEFLAGLALSGVAFGILSLLLFSGGVGSFLFFGVLGAVVPIVWVSLKARRRATRIKVQLPDVLGILASSMRVGHSFLQALDSVAKEIGSPADHEFNRAVAEIRLGRSTEDALNDLADRVGSEDFSWAVLAANIQRDMGGNLAEVLDTVAATLRERENVRRQIEVLSAEGRFSALVMTALPFVLGGYLYLVNPESFSLLFTTTIGQVFLVGGAILLTTGTIWMRKLVSIDV